MWIHRLMVLSKEKCCSQKKTSREIRTECAEHRTQMTVMLHVVIFLVTTRSKVDTLRRLWLKLSA